ncbi:MAG: hypothetical protein U1E62_05230 [Alsobacter sp.]
MVEAPAVNRQDSLKAIADEVARALSYARIRGNGVFVSTAVSYPNGSTVVVRLDEDRDGYFVSDDGHASFIAETMGANFTFTRVAPSVAERAGVKFDQRCFFILHVSREQLPAAVAAIANVSSRAVERTIYALEKERVGRSRDVFESRLKEAFGSKATFNVTVRGAQREWEFEGAVTADHHVATLFAFVAPAFAAIAAANLKIGDVRSASDAPRVVATLADYRKTDPALRSILSTSADLVMAANDDVGRYRSAA